MKKILIIAEIGWNHMGNISLAKKMIFQAKKSGADICKFQTWSEKNLKPGPWDTDGRREIYKKAELTKENHIYLIEECKNNNVEFLTSVFDKESLEFLKNIGIKKIKIPSHEIYNLELISLACEIFDEVLISTGASKWEEILDLNKKIESKNAVYLHCVSSYPCSPEIINLPKFIQLQKLFDKVGYSGHLQGIDDAIAAIVLGAVCVEKHFTIDNKLPGRDNQFAILPQNLKDLFLFRNSFQKMNINLGLDLQSGERDIYDNYRGRWSKDA